MCRGFEENEDLKVYEEKCSDACTVHIHVLLTKGLRNRYSLIKDLRNQNYLFSTAKYCNLNLSG